MASEHVGQDEVSLARLGEVDSILAIEVFQDALRKLQFLTNIAPDLEQHKDELTLYVGREISNIIEKQHRQETDFQNKIMERDQAISDQRTQAEIRALDEQVQKLALEIQKSTRDLCKNLKENPSVTENLVKTQQHRREVSEFVENALDEFQKTRSYMKLQHDIGQQYKVYQAHKQLKADEEAKRKAVKALNDKLDTMKREHAKRIQDGNTKLSELRLDLQFEKERAEQILKLLQIELQSANDECGRNRVQELIQLGAIIDQLLKAVEDEENAQKVLMTEVQVDMEELNKQAQLVQQTTDMMIEQLKTEKKRLEDIRETRVQTILKLEEQNNLNKDEYKKWKERQAFEKRMREAVFEARKMRLEQSRNYVQTLWKTAYDPPKKKKSKAKKNVEKLMATGNAAK